MQNRYEAETWAFVYRQRDTDTVNQFLASLHKYSTSLGMRFDGEPVWVEVPDDRDLKNEGVQDLRLGGSFLHCIREELDDDVMQQLGLVFVLVDREENKARIKRHFDSKGIVTQFMLAKNL